VTNRALLDRTVSESAFQDQVVEYAHVRSWRVAHFRAARTEKGYRTPVAADGAGFPDLVLVRDRVIFAELKSSTGRQSHDQKAWMVALRAADAEYHLWVPADWDDVEKTLR
jgi:hypothetical protein